MTIKQYICPVCTIEFKTEKSLHEHLFESTDLKHNHFYYNDSNKDEWVECKICALRKNILAMHLIDKHQMSSKTYKLKYGKIFSVKYEQQYLENFVKAGAQNLQRHETIRLNRELKQTKKCPVCEQKFVSDSTLSKHIIISDDKEHSMLIFDDLKKDSWVECKICGCRRSRIDFHVSSKHKMSIEEYKKKFSSEIFSKEYLRKVIKNGSMKHESWRISGANNPFFERQHSKETKKRIANTLLSKKDQQKIEKFYLELSETFVNQEECIDKIFEDLSNIS